MIVKTSPFFIILLFYYLNRWTWLRSKFSSLFFFSTQAECLSLSRGGGFHHVFIVRPLHRYHNIYVYNPQMLSLRMKCFCTNRTEQLFSPTLWEILQPIIYNIDCRISEPGRCLYTSVYQSVSSGVFFPRKVSLGSCMVTPPNNQKKKK